MVARTHLILAVGRCQPRFYALAYFALIPIFAAAYAYTPGLSLQCAQSDACGKFQALYFSTVTITTLGYGDVIPKGWATQAAAGMEALLGIVVIGLFLNSLSFAISSAAQQMEAESQRRAQRSAELVRFRNFLSVVRVYLARYRRYVIVATTPIGQQRQEKLRSGVDIAQDYKSLKISDLRDILKPTLLLSDDPLRSSAFYYFKAQDDLLQAIREFMQSVDLSRWPDIEQLCRKWIENCADWDWRDGILVWEKDYNSQNSLGRIFEKMLAEWTGGADLLPSNGVNPFIALFHLIKNSLEILEEFDAKVQSQIVPTTVSNRFN